METPTRVRVEIGAKRCFADALDWPGWCRSGRTPEDALAALVAYAGRYAAALRGAGGDVPLPASAADLAVTERGPGTATTDFGAPDTCADGDATPFTADELERQLAILDACWARFEEAAMTSTGPLRKGPRGGGRELDAIVAHVHDSTREGLARSGIRVTAGDPHDGDERKRLRVAFGAGVRNLSGAAVPDMGRSSRPPLPLRTLCRRTAWHTLDHLWEIEDRSGPAPGS